MTSCSLDISTQHRIQEENVTVKSPQKLIQCSFPLDSDPFVEREFFLRCLVFGDDQTGKHSLIAANFPAEKESGSNYIRNDVDFLNKTLEIPYNTKRYHFWTFRVNEKSFKKEALWRAYYKSTSAFVFVYDITNAQSFKRLEQLVQFILKVISQKEFFGVLVGNKNDLEDQREVSYDEAVSFKLKYGFSHFFETNHKTEQEHSQILNKLESRLKLTFESI